MASPIMRAVRLMSTVHASVSSVRSAALLRSTVFSPDHFPKFLAVISLASGVAGYQFMGQINRSEVREGN
jgi:hypothetical protein